MRITRLGFLFCVLGLSLAVFFYSAQDTDTVDTLPRNTGNFFLNLKNKAVDLNSEIQNTVHETVDLFVVETDENTRNQKLTDVEQKVPTKETSPHNDTLQYTPQTLSADGIISRTNYYRMQKNLSPLVTNDRLTRAAQKKVDDMFAQQYFEHESPQGIESDDLARSAGYVFIVVGENLALGEYESDFEVVEGWMDSPGHRENILSSSYTEIGVAVKQGVFEGDLVWLAVQEFGRPAADCPTVDVLLDNRIEESEQLLAELQRKLADMLEDIEGTKPAHGTVYEEKVAMYNELVSRYNVFVNEMKDDVATYNAQVKAYNTCVKE